MCDDLQKAINLQEQFGGDTTKGAMMLFKEAAKAMQRISEEMRAHIKASNKRHAETANKLAAISASVDELKAAFTAYQTDATKYRLIVEITKALFGDARRCVITLVYFGIIMGLVNMREIIGLLTAMV